MRSMDDELTESINHPSGRLTDVLLRKLLEGSKNEEIAEPLRTRFDKLLTAGGRFGCLARVRLAAEVSVLFERAPQWTTEKVIPLFQWSSPDAAAAWSARKYARYIGSTELFRLTKQPFLSLFERKDVSDEDIRIYASWLTTIMIANQADESGYPITSAEARSLLRKAGVKSLSSVAHGLAMEMERAKTEEKLLKWRDVVGPVFQSIWPLDVELQTSASTFKLVQILRASGAAFPHAVEVILPFIRPDDHRGRSTVNSVSSFDDMLYSSFPERMLDLIAAVVGERAGHGAHGVGKALELICTNAPQLTSTKKYQRLLGLVNNS